MRAIGFFRMALSFIAMTTVAGASAIAGTIDISGDVGKVVLEADRKSVEDVIGQLGKNYGFEVERIGGAAVGPAVWGHYEGSLRQVLARTLENQSHLVVSSPTGGIAKVVLYGPNCARPGQPSPQDAGAVVQPLNQTATNTGRPQPLAREVIAPAQKP